MVSGCDGCDTYGTSDGSTYASRGPQDASTFAADLGPLRLAKGFKLGINLMDVDPLEDDPMGSGQVVFEAPGKVEILTIEGAQIRVEFSRAL